MGPDAMIFVFWMLSFKPAFSLFSFTFIKLRQHITKQRHHFADKGLYGQSYGFSSSHVWMWELDNKEGWAPKNWCFQIVVLEKTPEGPLDSKEIKPVKPKGNQAWIFIGRTDDAKAEAPIIWPDVKSQLIGKDLDDGQDGKQKEKWVEENEIVREHHWLNGHEFEQTLGDGGGQGSLAYYSPWGHKESDMTEHTHRFPCPSEFAQIHAHWVSDAI